MNGSSVARTINCDTPAATYTSTMQATDWGGPVGATLDVRMAQVSPRFGAGTARRATLTL